MARFGSSFLSLAALLVAASCNKAKPAQGSGSGSGSAALAGSDTTPAASDACAAAKPEHGSRMAWFVDDYAAALKCAVTTKRPIVMDLWAPWCHTCLSMKTTVFTDAAMAAIADKFVFVAIDTDRDQNAATVAKYPLSAWPTFYVINPTEQVAGRLVGSATAAQFVAFVQGSQLTAAPDSVASLITQGDQAVTRGDFAAAEPLFAAALQKAPADFARRPELVLALLQTKAKRDDAMGCVTLAVAEAAHMGNASSASDAMALAMGCAEQVAKQNEAGAAAAKQMQTVAISTWTKLINDPAAQLSVDDRSDAMANLRSALDEADRHNDALAIAEKQRTLLDETASKAASPLAASTYNWPRAEVYVYLGRALDIAPVLVASANALPTEYDPPYRAAWAFFKGQKYADAALWANKANALVYGPRKPRVVNLLIDIAKAQGDNAAELAARTELVATYKALPPSPANGKALTDAEAGLAAMAAK